MSQPTAEATIVDDLLAYVRRVPLVPCLLVTLPGGRVAASNAGMRELLGVDDDDIDSPLLSAVTSGLWRSESMRLLVSGVQSGFASSTRLRLPGGRLEPCVVSARTARVGERRWALLVFDVRGESASPFHRSTDDPDIVFGVGDGETQVGDVSPSVQPLLGYAPDAIIGTKVTELVHEDDLAGFLSVTSTIVGAGRPGSLRIRVRHADGTWVPLRVMLSPLHRHPRRALAWVLFRDAADVAPGQSVADGDRLEEVEQRLRRIALELAALGITETAPGAMTPDVAAALGRLSPKRQEIVARLRAGARVPTVAREMYLSPSTVRNHLSAVFREFGVRSQEDLMRLLNGDD